MLLSVGATEHTCDTCRAPVDIGCCWCGSGGRTGLAFGPAAGVFVYVAIWWFLFSCIGREWRMGNLHLVLRSSPDSGVSQDSLVGVQELEHVAGGVVCKLMVRRIVELKEI